MIVTLILRAGCKEKHIISFKQIKMASSTAADVDNPATTAAAATNVPADIPDPATTDPYKYYIPLFYASLRGDWESAKQFLDLDPSALTAAINNAKQTALITAVRAGQFKFAEKLSRLMPPESLLHKDFDEFTVLHHAATRGNSTTTGMLVMKCPTLTQIRNQFGETPLLRAAIFGEEEILRYLLMVTRDDQEHSPFRGKDGATLLNSAIQVDLYDEALHLVQLYPEIVSTADKIGRTAIGVLAAKYWRFKYSTLKKLDSVLLNALLQLVPSVKKLSDGKIMYGKYLKLVKKVCSLMSYLDPSEIPNLLGGAILEASKNGHIELMKSIIDLCPTQIEYHNSVNGDTVLHLAAKMAPLSKLKEISGAALQMQRELQWYQEVEKIVPPGYLKRKNNEIQNSTNNELNQVAEEPRDVFSREHEKLLVEAEKWMKDMASSSMLVATLIATVVFAAAFTVPGGNVSDKGYPIFLSTPSYMVFAIANALAFFSSLTSVLMFLTLLTTRYAEDDFLKALPQKLIIGLSMLIFAIANMTIAFSATYFIMLGDKRLGVSIFIALLTSLPVALFTSLQFPLLLEMIHSTYWSKF